MPHPIASALEGRLRDLATDPGVRPFHVESTSRRAEDDEIAFEAPDGRRSTVSVQLGDEGLVTVGAIHYRTEEIDGGWAVVLLNQYERFADRSPDDLDAIEADVRAAFDGSPRPFERMGPKEIDDPVLCSAALWMRDRGATDVTGVEGRTDVVRATLDGDAVEVVHVEDRLEVSRAGASTSLDADMGSTSFVDWLDASPSTAPAP